MILIWVFIAVPLTEPSVATATEVAASSEVVATLANQVAATRKNGLTVPTQSASTGVCWGKRAHVLVFSFDLSPQPSLSIYMILYPEIYSRNPHK